MIRTTITPILLAVLAATVGCATNDSSSGNSNSSNDQSAIESSTCGIANAEVFVAPRIYRETAPIGGIEVSSDYLVFAPYDELYWVPITGGEPTSIPNVDAGYNAGHIRGNEVLFVGSKLWRFPIGDGDAVEEPLPERCGNGPEFSSDGNKFYCNSGVIYDPYSIDAWSYDLESKQSVKLLSAATTGAQEWLNLGGQYLYVAQEGGDGVRDTIYKLSVEGGAEVEVPITGDYTFDLIGSGADGLYLRGMPIAPYEETHDYGGIYRLPFDGGALEEVIEGYPVLAGAAVFVRKGKTILRFVNSVYEIAPGQDARLLAKSQCAVHGMAASEEYVFLATDVDTEEAYQILRLPL